MLEHIMGLFVIYGVYWSYNDQKNRNLPKILRDIDDLILLHKQLPFWGKTWSKICCLIDLEGHGFKSLLGQNFSSFFYIFSFYSMPYAIIKRSYKRWFFNFKENMISRGIFLVISCGEKGKPSYLLIFSIDFIFFAQSSFSIPHKWQKDTFWALAHFLARFLSISTVCLTSEH